VAGCASTPPPPAQAPEPQTVADLRARGAVRMSADEARAATVGTRVQTASGSAWTHDPDGSLSMLVRQRDFSGLMSFGGSGKWEVRQNGAYCVNITWQIHAHSFPEAWCVDLYALDGITWAAPRRRGGAGHVARPGALSRSNLLTPALSFPSHSMEIRVAGNRFTRFK